MDTRVDWELFRYVLMNLVHADHFNVHFLGSNDGDKKTKNIQKLVDRRLQTGVTFGVRILMRFLDLL